MAKSLFITQSAYSKLENGQIDINAKRLMKIAKILDVDISYFLSEEPPNNVGEENNSTYYYKRTIKKLNEEIIMLKSLIKFAVEKNHY